MSHRLRALKDHFTPALGLALLLIALFSGWFSWLAIQRFNAFDAGFDLAVYDQVVWNTLQGRFFFYTATGQPLLHLSNHADPILALLAPFYMLHSGPETLLVLQATLIGLAGLPVFLLARQKLHSEWAALVLLSAYLLFPGTQVVTLSDFHPPALAFAFLMWAFYFLENRRGGWFLLFALLAMATKEQIPLIVFFMGLYALIRHRDWKLALATFVVSIGWFAAVMYWIIPANSVVGEHIFLDYYAEFGDSPAEIVVTALTRPDLVLQNLWQPAKLAYLRNLFAPFGWLPLLGLPVLAVGTPAFAINLLSANPAMHTASRGHYVADVTPWLVWGTLFALVLIRWLFIRLWQQFKPGVDARRPALWVVNGLSTGLLVVVLWWHWGHGLTPLAAQTPHWAITNHHRQGQALLEQIPPDAPISAQIRLFAHLSTRKIAYVFPHIFEAEYILLDVTADTSPLHPNNQYFAVRDLLDSGEFGVKDARDGLILLQKGLDNPVLPDDFYNFARTNNPAPQYPLNLQFGDSLRLLGYDVSDDPRLGQTQVTLYWQADAPLPAGTRLYPFFIDANGAVIEDTSLRPLTTQLWYPPEMWQPGEVIVSRTVPWALGDDWSLAVGVLSGDDWSQWNQRLKVTSPLPLAEVRRFETNTWARVGSFQRVGRDLTPVTIEDSDLQPPQVAQFNFDDKMMLLGYQADQTGKTLDLTLFWEALALMGYDYTVFIHLVDQNGTVVAQHDGQPQWQLPIPTTTWQPGETIRDRHPIPLPPDLPPGTYTLRVGVYYWQTLERLPVLENGLPVNDFADIGTVGVDF